MLLRVGKLPEVNACNLRQTFQTFPQGLEAGVLILHSRPFFARIPHPPRIQFPEYPFSFSEKYIKKSDFYIKLINVRCRLILSIDILNLRVFLEGFRHSRQTRKHKSRIPCPIFGESRFPGNSQIPDPVNIFIVCPIPAPYFGQIPNRENTLPDPVPAAALVRKKGLSLRLGQVDFLFSRGLSTNKREINLPLGILYPKI